MTDIGKEIAHAIKNGLLHLSLHMRWDGKVWQAGYRNTDNHNVEYAEDPDWEKAFLKAIRAGTRSVKRTAATKPPFSEAEIRKKKADKAAERKRDADDLI